MHPASVQSSLAHRRAAAVCCHFVVCIRLPAVLRQRWALPSGTAVYSISFCHLHHGFVGKRRVCCHAVLTTRALACHDSFTCSRAVTQAEREEEDDKGTPTVRCHLISMMVVHTCAQPTHAYCSGIVHSSHGDACCSGSVHVAGSTVCSRGPCCIQSCTALLCLLRDY